MEIYFLHGLNTFQHRYHRVNWIKKIVSGNGKIQWKCSELSSHETQQITNIGLFIG